MNARTVQLGDVAEFTMGQAPPGSSVNTEGKGVPFYRSGEFGARKPSLSAWTTSPLRTSRPEDVWVCVVGANAGDINLGAEGAIGRSVAAISPKAELDYLYLYYYLRFREKWLRDQAAGSAQPVISKDDLYRIEIPLPAIGTQRKIAATLGSLDDKIEFNRMVQSKVITLAESLFRARAQSASLKPLSSVSTIALGGTPSKSEPTYWGGDEIGWLNSGTANQEVILEPTAFITQAGLGSSSAKLMPPGATVLAITGSTLGQVALLGIEAAGNQSLIGAWGTTASWNAWIHFAIRENLDELLTSATGAAQQHVNKSNVEQLLVPVISEDGIYEWGKVAVPLLERALSAASESLKLKRLREVLSPVLFSEGLRVLGRDFGL